MNCLGTKWMLTAPRTGDAPAGPAARCRAGLVVLAALLSFSLASAAWAADYYVDRTNPNCSDVGPGTQAQPYCAISAALAAHHDPGTTINVLPGLYREQVTLPASGLSDSPIVLKALPGPGQPVVVDGTDDFSASGLWSQYSGDVWLASSVTWAPVQVFADNTRLTASTAPAASLPARSFEYVAGSGLYVNAGGGNPGDHQTQVGHRPYGLFASGKSWARIEGFTVQRCDDRGIQLTSAASNLEVVGNTVSFSGRMGIQVVGGSGNRIASNVVSDNGDHGISLTSGATGCRIEGNEAFRNAYPTARKANGIYLYGCSNNVIQRNRWHDNQDTGEHIQSASNNNLSIQNLSWHNGDHGYDHLAATGNVHIGDVAYGNYKDGFSFEGDSPNNQLFDAIAAENGLTTNEFDLWVDATSSAGFESNDNLFWNSAPQSPVKVGTALYARVSDETAATGLDTRSLQQNPLFVNPAQGDFHLQSGSPAIDNANTGVTGWPETDAEGLSRADDPATPNRGMGPVAYADRGALEFRPSGSGGNQAPIAALTVTPASGVEPLAVTADASGSHDPDGTIASYRFDFGDGTVVGPQADSIATHTYAAGHWVATVVVTDDAGATGSASVPVTVTRANNQPPVAKLSITPSSGAAPLAVTADASASFDPDGTIVTYLFDFGDGTKEGPRTFATATHTYGAGNWTAKVIVTDSDGATGIDSVLVSVAPGSNLVGNPSFETDLTGWAPTGGATLQRVSGGYSGSYSMAVLGPANTSIFGVTDQPNWVASTPAAGTRYRFSAWVRSATSTGRVRIRVQESRAGQFQGWAQSSPVALSPSWTQLSLDYSTFWGGSTLDFVIQDRPAKTSEVFQVDAVSIVIVTPAPAATLLYGAPGSVPAADGARLG